MSSGKTQTATLISRKAAVVAVLAAIIVVIALVVLTFHWPFSQAAVTKDLEEASSSVVEIKHFRTKYFPHPGCVAESVTFRHGIDKANPPLITIKKLMVQGSFMGLFTKHVTRIRAEGLRIIVPPPGIGQKFHAKRSETTIDEIIANESILDFAARDPGKQPRRFAIHKCTFRNVGAAGPMLFQVALTNPKPPGEISASGRFGPWRENNAGQTPLSGNYTFQNADLGVFRGISGMLSSQGKFQGVLDHIEVQGATNVPAFKVTSSSHKVQLETQFHAFVNATNGDTFLQPVYAHFWRTIVVSAGSIAGISGHRGKTAAIDLAARDGRIQDVLRLFVKSERAPMTGVTSFRLKALIPPEKRPFLRKVELEGDFGVDAGTFTRADTQANVSRFSQGASGEDDDADPASVLSDLKGHVVLKDGTADFSNLSFSVPGAFAQLHGTYSIITHKIDLHGTLRTDAKLSKTAHGVRALLLKVLDPLFRKKPAGSLVPVKITGTYERPSFGLELSEKNSHRASGK
jgi:hypothetical protein